MTLLLWWTGLWQEVLGCLVAHLIISWETDERENPVRRVSDWRFIPIFSAARVHVWLCSLSSECLKCFSRVVGIHGSHERFVTLCVRKPLWNVCLLLNTWMCVYVSLFALIESGPWETGRLSCGVVISSQSVTGWVRWQSLTVKSISQINIAKACSPGSMNNECDHFGSKLARCLARRAWAHLCVSGRLPLAASVSLSICGGVLS